METAFREGCNQVHHALAHTPINRYRKGGPGNAYFTMEITENPGGGFHNVRILYSELGLKTIRKYIADNPQPKIPAEG
jgi:hypothetical protein